MTDRQRREFLKVTGSGALASLIGTAASAVPESTRAEGKTVRWGFVGTGFIAGLMSPSVKQAEFSELVAVSSRRMETAKEFADKHGIENTFDSWAEMAAWDGVDAIYVATPTSLREEICLAAANNGKHVLGEKPFASLPSVKRITEACRRNNVGFMDGTHFVHHPRTADIRARIKEGVGWPWSLDSAFQFNLQNRNNIRYNRDLEPMGAIGDAGWYNMRAAVEYLSDDMEIRKADAYLRRDKETGAAISGSGVMQFVDGSTTTWTCGFDSGAVAMDLRISGANGVIRLDNFLMNNPDGSAGYTFHKGGFGPNRVADEVNVASSKSGSVLMFEDFAAMVADPTLREKSMHASEQTQRLLDAVWASALENE